MKGIWIGRWVRIFGAIAWVRTMTQSCRAPAKMQAIGFAGPSLQRIRANGSSRWRATLTPVDCTLTSFLAKIPIKNILTVAPPSNNSQVPLPCTNKITIIRSLRAMFYLPTSVLFIPRFSVLLRMYPESPNQKPALSRLAPPPAIWTFVWHHKRTIR
jgi:hypothetical protein